MPRNYGTIVENNFVNGLVTEATGLNFPDAAVTSSSNVIFNEDGSVEVRKGLDYEATYVLNTVTRSNSAIVEYLWTAVASRGDIEFVVQQVGDKVYFYRVSTDAGLSEQRHATVLDLDTYKVSGAPTVDTEPCSFASGKGFLFVTHKYCEPFYVEYDTSLNTFTATQINIKIRDFEGVEDGYDYDERPATLTEEHAYNLLNQGWDYVAEKAGGGGNEEVIVHYFNQMTVYPSNAEQWWLYKNSTEQFDPREADRFFPGNSKAPNGHFIFSAWDTTRNATYTTETITGVTETTAGYFRPACCSFFAGRVFYAGVEASGYAGNIYFSQIVEKDSQLGLCHQVNDPTSESNSDLLASDGGVIRILDIGTVYRLFPTQKALLVFASNGVWSISGSDVNSFNATDYTIKKVTSTGVNSGLGIIDALGTPVFWNSIGVWTFTYEAGDFFLQSLSDKKIKSYLADIPMESVSYAKGVFDEKTKILQWVYRATAPDTVDTRYEYNRFLNLNMTTGAFYTFSVTSATKFINGVVSVRSGDSGAISLVTTGAGTVTAAGGDVYVYDESTVAVIKYFVSKVSSGTTYNSTWAEFNDTDYKDWDTDGEDLTYVPELFSGYKVAGEGNKEFQSNYIVVYTENVTNSSAFIQGCWDFSNSNSSFKWSTAQQIYNSSPNYRDFRSRKLKIRGWGKSLQFRIYGEAGKPFKIIGWSVFVSGNSVP